MQRSLFLLFFLISFAVKSQQAVKLFVDGVLVEDRVLKDTLSSKEFGQNQVRKLVKAGYYFAGEDSIVQRTDGLNIYLHMGEKLKSRISDLKGNDIARALVKKVTHLGESGYPFARVRIDSFRSDSKKLTGQLIEEKGPFIVNDSSFFFREMKTSHQFIYQLLDHVPGEAFSESSYQSINDKMERSSFLSLVRPVDISFQNQKAQLYLDIEESDAGSFQGILGLQQTTLGKSEVVGSFDLAVQNLFRSGKEFEVSWERFRENSQALSISYDHPFVLGSKISPSLNFDLLKQDSTFLQRSTGLGFSTYVSPKAAIHLKYLKMVGTLLSTDEQLLTNSDLADFETDLYQITAKQGRFEGLTELTAGYAWESTVGLGTKSIERNLSVADSFYDTLALKTNIFQFDFQSMLNLKISNRLVVNHQLQLGIIKNEELLNNERYRLGGLGSLRGFDEKSIFADQYLLSRAEIRSFFEKGSFLFVFYDQLLFRNGDFSDTPFGSGLGFSLSTLSGQFSFAVAIGKSKTQRVDFSRMKVHFGYITRF